MADFNRSQIFNGTCAPFLYIADCTPMARTAYMNASRFWLAANSIALIALVTSLIRRSILIKERLNTLRLTVICFTIGAPLYVGFQFHPSCNSANLIATVYTSLLALMITSNIHIVPLYDHFALITAE